MREIKVEGVKGLESLSLRKLKGEGVKGLRG